MRPVVKGHKRSHGLPVTTRLTVVLHRAPVIEIEINPLIVRANGYGAVAVDVRGICKKI